MRRSVVFQPQSSPPGCVLCMNSPVGVAHSTDVYALPAASFMAPSAALSIRWLARTCPPSSTTAPARASSRAAASSRTPDRSASAISSERRRCPIRPSIARRSGRGRLLRPAEPAVGTIRRDEAHEDQDHGGRAEVRVERRRARELLRPTIANGLSRVVLAMRLGSAAPPVLLPRGRNRPPRRLRLTVVSQVEAQEELQRLVDEQSALRHVATLVAAGADEGEGFAAGGGGGGGGLRAGGGAAKRRGGG